LRNESFLQKKTAPPVEGEAMLIVPMVTLFYVKASYLFFMIFPTHDSGALQQARQAGQSQAACLFERECHRP
jgi:hypothetical protein